VLILYFHPKADTAGCTREAQDFSALKADFTSAGATIVGLSPDPVSAIAKFRDKYGLQIALASDGDHAVAERYGVWGEKSMYGRKFMGVERSTFLIGRDGQIVRVWRKVRVEGHAAEVLTAAQNITAP
jgi:peroxiredoxin Q/BCP